MDGVRHYDGIWIFTHQNSPSLSLVRLGVEHGHEAAVQLNIPLDLLLTHRLEVAAVTSRLSLLVPLRQHDGASVVAPSEIAGNASLRHRLPAILGTTALSRRHRYSAPGLVRMARGGDATERLLRHRVQVLVVHSSVPMLIVRHEQLGTLPHPYGFGVGH
jgi:hypothetical protein